MRYAVRLLLCLALVCQPVSAQTVSGEKVGIVLMHGKGGRPGPAGLASALRRAGALVETPEMPWSRGRIYAKSYDDSMGEIDAAVERLRKAGATRIVVAGQSMGANAALGYAARRGGLAGIMLFAPGHLPGLAGFDGRVASGVERARQMVAQGKGDVRTSFPDVNQGETLNVATTAQIYLSWFAPDGPAVWPRNAAAIKSGTPVFCADGSREPNPSCPYATAGLPANAKNKVVRVGAGHMGVADSASGQVLVWLRGLGAALDSTAAPVAAAGAPASPSDGRARARTEEGRARKGGREGGNRGDRCNAICSTKVNPAKCQVKCLSGG
jgi:pimeloyl-ACP methyl ester carboxylesterase